MKFLLLLFILGACLSVPTLANFCCHATFTPSCNWCPNTKSNVKLRIIVFKTENQCHDYCFTHNFKA
ncbi:unnamed protein product [Cylicocyclus nassatus]|uniref:Three-finger toxin n=1 Tax=Cylicocyclus nassatus TaxID=53992 RepID=A0AA36M8L5_CYLNA|nr:unnamed protein product [Cylicocyclus nassatus]